MKIEIKEEDLKMLIAYAVIGANEIRTVYKAKQMINEDLLKVSEKQAFLNQMQLEDYHSQLKGEQYENK